MSPIDIFIFLHMGIPIRPVTATTFCPKPSGALTGQR